jgi:hypothetical protein
VINQIDLAALRQALAIMRASSDPHDREYVESHLRDERWDVTAANCAMTLQERALNLRPWELCPAAIRDLPASLKAPENHKGERRAAAMLQKMLALGVSRHAPDPVRAIADAEQRKSLS